MTNPDEMQIPADVSKASTPHLTNGMVGFALALIITHAYGVLIQQPPIYWMDYHQNVSNLIWDAKLLSIHPMIFFGAAVFFAGIISLILKKLPRSLALILWVQICFIYTYFIYNVDIRKILAKYTNLSGNPLDIAAITGLLCLSGIAGWVLAGYIVKTKQLTDEVTAPTLPVKKHLQRAGIASITTIWIVFINGLLFYSILIPKTGWRPIKSAVVPSPRYSAKVAYDTQRRVAVLFGGFYGTPKCGVCKYTNFTETWEWNGNTWSQITTNIHPPERDGFAMSYDANRNVVVLFGGKNNSGFLQDTWEWNGSEWRQVHPVSAPPARYFHTMAYDPRRKQVIVFGGENENSKILTDAWGWNGQDWQEILNNTELMITGNEVVYNHVTDGLMAITGATWFWENDQWRKEHYDPTPPYRQIEALAYDSLHEQVILFGGKIPNSDETTGYLNDTWIFNSQGWTKFHSQISPQARKGHVMFFDEFRGKVILFGGYDGENYLNDMWELALPSE